MAAASSTAGDSEDTSGEPALVGRSDLTGTPVQSQENTLLALLDATVETTGAAEWRGDHARLLARESDAGDVRVRDGERCLWATALTLLASALTWGVVELGWKLVHYAAAFYLPFVASILIALLPGMRRWFSVTFPITLLLLVAIGISPVPGIYLVPQLASWAHDGSVAALTVVPGYIGIALVLQAIAGYARKRMNPASHRLRAATALARLTGLAESTAATNASATDASLRMRLGPEHAEIFEPGERVGMALLLFLGLTSTHSHTWLVATDRAIYVIRRGREARLDKLDLIAREPLVAGTYGWTPGLLRDRYWVGEFEDRYLLPSGIREFFDYCARRRSTLEMPGVPGLALNERRREAIQELRELGAALNAYFTCLAGGLDGADRSWVQSRGDQIVRQTLAWRLWLVHPRPDTYSTVGATFRRHLDVVLRGDWDAFDAAPPAPVREKVGAAARVLAGLATIAFGVAGVQPSLKWLHSSVDPQVASTLSLGLLGLGIALLSSGGVRVDDTVSAADKLKSALRLRF